MTFFKKLRHFLLKRSRRQKRLLQTIADTILVWLALWLAFVVRTGSIDSVKPLGGHLFLFIGAPLITLPLFSVFGLYRIVTRRVGDSIWPALVKASALASLLLTLLIYWYQPSITMPRSMVINYFLLCLLLSGTWRLLARQYLGGTRHWVRHKNRRGLPKVAIYGAGEAGNQLLSALKNGHLMHPVAFIDDDHSLAGRLISGIKVYKGQRLTRMIEQTGATEVLLALPSISRARRREILEQLEAFPLHVRTVPGLADLASGKVQVGDVQEVDIADLLGRDPVPPQGELLSRCIKSQVVLVSGAGGSIGAELCRQIVQNQPNTLILFEHSEYNLYAIHHELQALICRLDLNLKLIPILGSVSDAPHLLKVLQSFQVTTFYHAAAYKHVPLVEQNMAAGVFNNVFGTLHAAEAALKAEAAHFVLISTDKAVRPTNVMGASKRLAEMVLQALSQEAAPTLFSEAASLQVNKTRFSMVRFGNVLGSSGSVIPLFRKQIAAGGPITVTHPDITRYFMTIPEAASLVIQAGAMSEGGEVFVLDMGEPVKIAELAEKMIHLSGLSLRDKDHPEGDIAIEFTGLRHGEKLYEELLIGDNPSKTDHPMILCAQEERLPWPLLKTLLAELLDAIENDHYPRIRELLQQAVSGYAPQGAIVDGLFLQGARHPQPSQKKLTLLRQQ